MATLTGSWPVRLGSSFMLSHCRRPRTATSNEWTNGSKRWPCASPRRAEADRGAEVQDVSNPEKARAAGLSDWPGFDLLSRYPDGEVRSIEVKGRAGRSAVRMEFNEWKQACNLGERYWLYVVYGCATPEPRLYRVQDPFRTLLASEHGASAFMITVGNVVKAADAETPSHGDACR